MKRCVVCLVLFVALFAWNATRGLHAPPPIHTPPPRAAPPTSAANAADLPANKVEWHADFETACRAARDSGRPVLLFQLLGRLDSGVT